MTLLQNKAQELYTFFFFFQVSKFLQENLPRRANSDPGAHSPHDWAAVASFVGARVATTWGGRRVTGMDVNGTQLIPAQHGQKVLLPWGGRAVARLV